MTNKGRVPKALLSLMVILVFLLSGCGGRKGKGIKTIEGDPEILYKQGLSLFNKRDYKKAIEKFEELKSNFPDSPPFTIWAELKIADCHFFLKSYVEAVTAYEEFKKIHPTYEEIAYVQYQIGMSYFSQMTTADRDQTFTQKALASFEYLIANSPPSLFTEKAKEKIGDCQRQLAEHEFGIGEYYYRDEKFQAAASRFEGLLAKYPKWLDQDKTLLLLGKSYIRLGQEEKAREALNRLIQEYPKSHPAKEAKKILAAGLTDKTALKKAKAIAAKKNKGTAETDPEGLVLVKYDEENKKAASFLSPTREDSGPVPSRPSPATPSPVIEAAKPVPPKGGAEKVESSPSPPAPVPSEVKKTDVPPALPPVPLSSAMEEAAKPIRPAEGSEKVESLPPPRMEEERAKSIAPTPSEGLKIAMIPGGESPKSLPPSRSEPAQRPLPGGQGLLNEKEKPKKEVIKGSKGPLQEVTLTDSAHPIDITSDSVETYTKENLILFRGNVMARQKDIVIYADSLEAMIIDNGKGIEKVVAGGNVKIQQGLRVANCEKAVFYNLDKRVVLTGDPRVREGDNIVSGEEIVFDIEQNRIEVKGGTSGRGKVRVYPKLETEKKE
jgi:outer membrane protein assembly factor BamD